MKKYFPSLLSLCAFTSSFALAQEAPFDPSGRDTTASSTQSSSSTQDNRQVSKDPRRVWLTQDGKAKVKIESCPGNSRTLCGSIVWLKEPKNERGEEKQDVNNPDESLRNRPLMGLHMLKNFHQQGDEWVDGEIYNPKNGKTYSCTMYVNEQGQLDLRGYVGIKLFGETQIWTPAD